MMPVSLRRAVPVLSAFAALAAPWAQAAEKADWSRAYTDLRVGWSTTPGLRISEGLSSYGSDIGAVDWEGCGERGNRFAVTMVSGTAHDRGGLFWGASLATTRWMATPTDGYSAGSKTYAPGLYEITDWYHAVELQLGYQYGLRVHDRLQCWFELAPLASAGLVQAQTETRTGGTYRRDEGIALGYEYGGRLGVYCGERHWMVGMTAALTGFQSTIAIDTVDVGGSDLTLRATGARLGVEAGYRF